MNFPFICSNYQLLVMHITQLTQYPELVFRTGVTLQMVAANKEATKPTDHSGDVEVITSNVLQSPFWLAGFNMSNTIHVPLMDPLSWFGVGRGGSETSCCPIFSFCVVFLFGGGQLLFFLSYIVWLVVLYFPLQLKLLITAFVSANCSRCYASPVFQTSTF